MSKHIISQDTPVAQLEQMVYDALTEINENMTNVAECNSMGNLYDMVMSGFTVYDEDVVTIEMVKRIREEWVSDIQEIEQFEQFDSTEVTEAPADEFVAEQVDGIRCGECGADVSDTEDGWCECMDKYEGRPSRGHCATCGDELTHDSLCSCTLGVDMDSIGKPIASVADLRAYLA